MKLKRLTVSVNLATALRSQTKSGMTILGVVVQFCRFFYLSAPSSAARHSCIRGKRNALEMKLKMLNSVVSVNLATALRSQTNPGMTILGVVARFCRFFYLSAPSSASRHSRVGGNLKALEMKLKMLNSVVSVNLATALRSQTNPGMTILGVVARFCRFFYLSAPSSASRHSRVGGNLKALEMKLKMLNSVVSVNLATALRSQTNPGITFLWFEVWRSAIHNTSVVLLYQPFYK